MLYKDPSYPDGPFFLYPRAVFEAALLGHAQRPGDTQPLAIYDFALCVDAVHRHYAMTREEATEYVSTQCEGSWLGPGSPLILHPGLPDE